MLAQTPGGHNRFAAHQYEILETYRTACLTVVAAERVKSIRARQGHLREWLSA